MGASNSLPSSPLIPPGMPGSSFNPPMPGLPGLPGMPGAKDKAAPAAPVAGASAKVDAPDPRPKSRKPFQFLQDPRRLGINQPGTLLGSSRTGRTLLGG